MWLGRLVDGSFFASRCGVFTSSVLMASNPFRLTVCTILSSRKVPLALIFLGLEENDIVGTSLKFTQNKQSIRIWAAESPYGK